MDTLKTYQKVNRQNAELTFGISRMEDIYKRHGGKADAPHRHGFYTMLLIEKAKGKHIIDFKSYPLSGMEVFFISPGQVHQMKEEEASVGYSIVFSIDFLLQNHIPPAYIHELNLFRESGDSPPLPLEEAKFIQLQKWAEEIINFNESVDDLKYDSIGALLKLMLIACKQVCTLPIYQAENSDKKSIVVKEFKEQLEIHHLQWHKSKQYADALNLSPDHLNRVVKATTGKTTKEHIQSRIMVAAKRLLYFSDLSNKAIAYELGFDEPANFSAFFKSCSGMSPTEFKAKH